jgi:hypothetical protein
LESSSEKEPVNDVQYVTKDVLSREKNNQKPYHEGNPKVKRGGRKTNGKKTKHPVY